MNTAKTSIILCTLLGLLTGASATAATETPRRCYDFDIPQSPAATPVTPHESQTWCYQRLISPAGATYIYNADGEKVRPELALIVEPDGTLTHGSLLAGEVTVHRVNSMDFNPFPVPLEEPAYQQPVFDAKLNDLNASADETLAFLMNARIEDVGDLTPREGEIHAEVSSSYFPWRGYWWPFKGLPLSGPLSKYDRFVAARTGSSPRAAAWEASHHFSTGVWWQGHCNGWASSSLLRAEPKTSKRDPVSGTVFSVSDQKGILAEKDFCSTVAFFGHRYNGLRTDDPRDIYPPLFHKTLIYYIGQLHKPVAMDYHADPVIDNHVVSGYTMNIVRTSSTTMQVTATLTVHKYDGFITNIPGTAPTYQRIYRYVLNLNASGQVVSGRWLSANPDFLWVPLAPSTCPSNNQRMTEQWTEAILALPPGT